MLKTLMLKHLSRAGCWNKNCSFKICRAFSDSGDNSKHPIRRTLNILRNDMRKVKNFFVPSFKSDNSKYIQDAENKLPHTQEFDQKAQKPDFQTHCDVLIIGGGMTGSSVAYWLKKKARQGLNVVIVDRDPTYANSSVAIPASGLRQQFSLPENIEMSIFGADFIRNAKEDLGVDLNFTPHGCLMLASEKEAETLKRNSYLQNGLGARNELLTADRLQRKFPWLNTQNVALGCHGLEKEGWFDPLTLLMGFKSKAIEYGAHYVNAELAGFVFQNQADMMVEGVGDVDYNSLDKAIVKMPDGEERTIKFAVCVLAAGAHSGQVARLAKIGTGAGILRIPLPIEPQLRYVHAFNTEDSRAPGLCTPFTVDPDGTHFRRDGLTGNYIGSRTLIETKNELQSINEHFENEVKPALARRAEGFKSAKANKNWKGYYGLNAFDENGIVGPHAYYNNLYIAAGFSGHGFQQTPAVGRAISELIIDGQFRTIDLTRLGFDRIIVDRPLFETCVI